MQLMPQTARRVGVENSFDAEENIRGGVRYLSELLQMFGGDVPLALAAYNAGEGRVSRLLVAKRTKSFSGIAGALPAETRMYVPKVCAPIATRTGIAPEKIPSPRRD